MSNLKIKYIMIDNALHKIEEHTYHGAAGSTHTGSNINKVPFDQVEGIKNMLTKEGRDIEVKVTDNEI